MPTARRAVAPNAESFVLITQNVDGLSRKAAREALLLGSNGASDSELDTQIDASLLEMHGRLFETLCSKCGRSRANFDSPICEALAGTEAVMNAGDEVSIPVNDLPTCQHCGGLLRPNVVWFGGRPYHLDEIDQLVETADLCLVVGTSSTVYPAARYASEVQETRGKVAVFNLERSAGDSDADFLFLGPCEELLPQALGLDEIHRRV